jgi:hypothetical protein
MVVKLPVSYFRKRLPATVVVALGCVSQRKQEN